MNVFITVGTTPFDDLIRVCDETLGAYDYSIKAQISDSATYIPVSFDSFAYDSKIMPYYNWADVIVAHAGAGTFYQLMELGKKVILVPNSELKDGHQNDICTYAQNNNYAYVLEHTEEIAMILEKIQTHKFNHYTKDPNEISSYICQLIKTDGPSS